MKLTVYIFAIALVVITVMFAVRTESTSQEKKAKPNKAMVKRGAYLVNVGGCNDCHSPKVFTKMGPMPDEKRLLSGHPAGSKMPDLPPGIIAPTPDKWGAISTNDFTAWVGPWGTSFTSNITPDDETGIGTWSESMFIGAMKTGKHMGIGRDILPPMPWMSLGQMTTDDLKAVFAYLQSLPPISNAVPDPISPDGQSIPTPKKLE